MAFLLISAHLEEFYSQFEILIKEYLDYKLIDYNSREVSEAVLYQKLRIPDCNGNKKYQANFLFNFPEYFEKWLSNTPVKLREQSQSLIVVQPDFKGDKVTFARMVILWGRKSGLIERRATWVDLEQAKIKALKVNPKNDVLYNILGIIICCIIYSSNFIYHFFNLFF